MWLSILEPMRAVQRETTPAGEPHAPVYVIRQHCLEEVSFLLFDVSFCFLFISASPPLIGHLDEGLYHFVVGKKLFHFIG